MKYDPNKHHRRSIRLKGYDYSQAGAYFVTICAYNRECLFGEIVDGKMALNELGEIVREEWIYSTKIRNEIKMDEYVVMPNHIHGIVIIKDVDNVPVGVTGRSPLQRRSPLRQDDRHPHGPKPKSIGSFIAGFKSVVTKRINELRKLPGASVWQPNYYDHIIRDEKEYYKIKNYIKNNPAQWIEDKNNPNSIMGLKEKE